MTPSLGDHLVKKGYTIVARAPKVGLPQLADGSWHVVGGSNPTQPGLMHNIDENLIPFILSNGGDIVLYRLSDDGMVDAKPVLSRGGMEGRPPDLSTVVSFDPELVRLISEMPANPAKAVAPPAPPTPKAKPRIDLRIASCAMAGLLMLLGAAGYFAMPSPASGVPGRWVPDMTNPRDVAITRGASVIAVPSRHNPEILSLYRIYPKADGKGARDLVGEFNKRDLAQWKGELPDSRAEWRRDY